MAWTNHAGCLHALQLSPDELPYCQVNPLTQHMLWQGIPHINDMLGYVGVAQLCWSEGEDLLTTLHQVSQWPLFLLIQRGPNIELIEPLLCQLPGGVYHLYKVEEGL